MQDLINRIEDLKKRLDQAWQVIKLDEKRHQVIELQHKMSSPGFWDDNEKATAVSQESSDLEEEIHCWEQIKSDISDLLEITELDKDDQAVNLRKEITEQVGKLEKRFQKAEFELLFQDKYDKGSAIIAIHAGAGGTDAQDWAEMLLRMYLRFAEKQNWKTNIVSLSAGSEAGIKSVMLEIKGKYSYGYLSAEAGVHRLVRISPFDAEKMRHTSFALLEVLPLLDQDVEVEIKSDDLRIDTFRAGGHGGQGVNTTDSAVRITHLPTKITVSCQNERSQQQNKDTAMKILKAKLQRYYESELEEEKQQLRGEYTEAAWGNQVRSYVLHPYKMVKDHRTNFEVSDVEKVLDGDLIEFVEVYLRKKVEDK
jgi:peptide chain release factor 2